MLELIVLLKGFLISLNFELKSLYSFLGKNV